jgi:hypothetical protein
VSAYRNFETGNALRDLTFNTEREVTACFFTLDGKQGCTAPRMLSLNKPGDMSGFKPFQPVTTDPIVVVDEPIGLFP